MTPDKFCSLLDSHSKSNCKDRPLSTPVVDNSHALHNNTPARSESSVSYFSPTPLTPAGSVESPHPDFDTPGLRLLHAEVERISSCSEDSMSPSVFQKRKSGTDSPSTTSLRQRYSKRNARKNIGLVIEESLRRVAKKLSPLKEVSAREEAAGTPTSSSSTRAYPAGVSLPSPAKVGVSDRARVGAPSPRKAITSSSAKVGAFVSPSKRAPKRAVLMRVVEHSPLKGAWLSTWEAKHNVNNLDNYSSRLPSELQVEQQEQPPRQEPLLKSKTPSKRAQSAGATKKPKADALQKKRRVHVAAQQEVEERSKSAADTNLEKTPKKSERLRKLSAPDGLLDVNMEIVPQLKTPQKTPRRPANAQPTDRKSGEDIHAALGLVRNDTPTLPEAPLRSVGAADGATQPCREGVPSAAASGSTEEPRPKNSFHFVRLFQQAPFSEAPGNDSCSDFEIVIKGKKRKRQRLSTTESQSYNILF
jgi:hypothetical protein